LGKLWLSQKPVESKVSTSVCEHFFSKTLWSHAINFLTCSWLYCCIGNEVMYILAATTWVDEYYYGMYIVIPPHSAMSRIQVDINLLHKMHGTHSGSRYKHDLSW